VPVPVRRRKQCRWHEGRLREWRQRERRRLRRCGFWCSQDGECHGKRGSQDDSEREPKCGVLPPASCRVFTSFCQVARERRRLFPPEALSEDETGFCGLCAGLFERDADFGDALFCGYVEGELVFQQFDARFPVCEVWPADEKTFEGGGTSLGEVGDLCDLRLRDTCQK